jgi:hypothetical protein
MVAIRVARLRRACDRHDAGFLPRVAVLAQ